MQVYLDGQTMPMERARISPLDRGFIFGDGIYEGLRMFDGRMRALPRHEARMRESLREARIDWDVSRLGAICHELADANGLADAFFYVQVTRGAPGPGDPMRVRVPASPLEPTVFAFCQPQRGMAEYTQPDTTTIRVVEDFRWARGRVKSVSLIGAIMAGIEASDAGARDALFVRGGLLAEATASNVLVAIPDGRGGTRVATPALESGTILAGVTRSMLLEADASIEERPVTEDELRRASEVILTGTMTMIASVVTMDGTPVGDGSPGPVARRLLRTLLERIQAESEAPRERAGAGRGTSWTQ